MVMRFAKWLEPYTNKIGAAIKELFTKAKKNQQIRKERRRQARARRKNRSRMRKAIFWRMIGRMLIFTAAFIAFLFLYNNIDAVHNFIEDIVSAILMIIPGEQYFYDLTPYFLAIYIAVIFISPLVSLYRASGYLDSIYIAADGILDKSSELPEMPARINDLDMKLRSVRLAVIENEQIAREAEQRKNDLVVYLAHDLKTPLSSVIGYLTLLDELPDLPIEQRAKYTSIALDKAYRLEQLINEFFDITRFNLQTVEVQNNRINLVMMLMQIADEFYPVLEEKKLTIRLDVPSQLMMTGDADKLMRVFDNLLRNAASYSYENTEIVLAARQMNEGSVEIICRNIGDRIPPQSLERLFDKFFRVDAARHSDSGGSGLGLAIARHIVELHGGEITAKSSEKYTQFRIVLPVRQQS